METQTEEKTSKREIKRFITRPEPGQVVKVYLDEKPKNSKGCSYGTVLRVEIGKVDGDEDRREIAVCKVPHS